MEKAFIRFEKFIHRLIRSKDKTIEDNHKKLYQDLKKELERVHRSYEIDGQLTFDEMVKYDRLKKLDKFVKDHVTGTYNVNKVITRTLLTDIVKRTRENTQTLILGELPKESINYIPKKYDVSKTVNNRMGGLMWTERLDKHRDDTIFKIQSAIKQGLDNGDTYSQVAKVISKEVGISYEHARVISRTEGARCLSQTRTDELNELNNQGVVMMKWWINSEDERVREQHREMGGRDAIPYESDFVLPDGTVTFAPVQTGRAEHDIQCRCIIGIRVMGVRDKK